MFANARGVVHGAKDGSQLFARARVLFCMKKILFAGALFSLLIPGTALCAKKNRVTSDSRAEKFLRQHDRDHNGTIERSEFPGKQKRFDRVDSNHDGKLNKAELDAVAPRREHKKANRGKVVT